MIAPPYHCDKHSSCRLYYDSANFRFGVRTELPFGRYKPSVHPATVAKPNGGFMGRIAARDKQIGEQVFGNKLVPDTQRPVPTVCQIK